MKRILFLVVFFILFSFSLNLRADVYAEVGIFYDSLAPYGDWIYLDTYGVWVWRPVGLWSGWQPYTYGRWEWSEEYGWIWVSYFEWGWATFHYGRWFYYDYYGWVWVPGTIWRPHWVVWVHNGPYIGWYPYYPSFIYIDYYSPVIYERWVIIEASNIDSGRYQHYAIPNDRKTEIFGSTSGVHKYIPKEDDNSYHNYGPPKNEIEKYSSKEFKPVKTEFLDKPINIYKPQDRKIQIYKPEFKSKFGDIGKINDNKMIFNKGSVAGKTGENPMNLPKKDRIFKPRYDYPLGSSHPGVSKGYYNFNPHNNVTPNKSDTIYNYRDGYDYKFKGDNNYGDNNLREKSVKSYSPSGKKFIIPSGSSDDDDEDFYKKSLPRFTPKSNTVPKSVPRLKDK